MVAITATNSATVSLQVTLNRMRLEQARREADQAEAYAQSLRAQADDQEGIVQKARGQAQTLQQRLNATPSSSGPVAKVATTPTQSSDTYIQNLADIAQFAKPLLKSDLSAVQKNIVTGSLLEAANVVSSALTQASSKAIQNYGSQDASVPNKAVGKVLNATA